MLWVYKFASFCFCSNFFEFAENKVFRVGIFLPFSAEVIRKLMLSSWHQSAHFETKFKSFSQSYFRIAHRYYMGSRLSEIFFSFY